jgi:hypothetical protein
MDLSLLATLKDKLIHAEQFNEVMIYFFDHFGDHSDFIALGERVSHELVENILETVAEQLFGQPVPVTHLFLTRLPEHQFVHGGAKLGGKMATVLYFEDICKGLLAVIWSSRTSETKFIRFTGMPLPDKWKRSVN